MNFQAKKVKHQVYKNVKYYLCNSQITNVRENKKHINCATISDQS